ncbi:ABC transporter substrate-binding protein [Paenibacillus terrigena]|uniref:ABC transporter substrate-binding protein n=1 Tax=Paenibacillus terrigena TaxID=369333 RepID=UPI00036DC19C|nr:ABC transporter substrate-binding protein [Paenibacillus terrigena]
MVNKTKTWASKLVLLCFAFTIVLAGCGKDATTTPEPTPTKNEDKTTDQPKESALTPVELTYYFPNTPQKDLQSVEDELNKLVQPKINATIKLKLIDWGSYDEKMNVIISSGEPYDIAFTSTWTNNFYQGVAKGAFAPLDELIEKYAPDTKSSVPETFWKAVKVKGATYGVPNFQQSTAGYGYLIQKSVADKYKFDWKSVTKLSDLTPMLETIKKGEPTLIPWGYSKAIDPFLTATPMFHLEALGDSKTPGSIYLNDTEMKVVNQYETPEFKEYVTMMRDWYMKGYVRKEAPTLKDDQADLKAGKVAAQIGQIDIDTTAFEQAGMSAPGRFSNSNKDVQSYDHMFIKPLLTTDKAAASITAISASSPNKERAMMFINLLNTDKQIYNLINWGVEGKHYKKVADNRIETIADSGFKISSPWEFGNMSQTYYTEADAQGAEVDDKGNKLWIDLNKNAPASNAMGFVFDFTPVKSEKANVDAAIDELYYAIATGSIDPEKNLPVFLNRLKDAGADKIIAEKQKQLDEWRAANK